MDSRLATALASVVLVGTTAQAQEGDGLYGRFDASTSVVLGAGASIGFGDDGRSAGAVVDARVRVLDAGGVGFTLHTDGAGVARLVSGIELRPFFPALFLQDLFTGRPYVDLLVQSLGIDLGVDVGLASGAPLGFAWGFSIEVPLLTPEHFAHGLGLRLGLRRSRLLTDSRPNTGVATDLDTWTGYALLCVGLDAGNAVADWEPPRHRHR